MTLPQSGAHPNAVDMSGLSQVWREILSNARDWVIDQNLNRVHTLDVTAGGTITLTIDQQYAGAMIRLTGTPGASFIIEMLDGNCNLAFDNTSGQTATIDTVTGAASPPTVVDGATLVVQERGTEFTTTGVVGLEPLAMLHGGSVLPTAGIPWADFELKGALLLEYAFKVTSPTSSSGTLILDMVNSNYFDVTLTEDVTTLTLNNPPASGRAGSIILIARQDGTGTWDITWPGSVIWERATGQSPAQTTTPNAVDIYWLLTTDGGTTWYGTVLGLNMS